MSTKELKQMEAQIQKIKQQLLQIGPMRPGSLTRQYKRPKDRKGAYYQLSYTHKMQSRTEYVRPEFTEELRQQIVVYKRFRKLVNKWVELAIEHSRLKMNQMKTKGNSEKPTRSKK